ncbi:zinc transporter ZIP3-like [Pollicipes pollicipes]|uniref:zinc transporter ZIP3-like n=1 Tax=Pollicipes pollicipes TaxID=41117 RepID=UPI00188593B9|nr:zinc transporter ZIP3-like [Pollicipes pollicipes]
MADSVLLTKVVCLVLFAVISLTCGLLPLVGSRLARAWSRHHAPGKTLLRFSARLDLLVSCVLCLGGGVLLGTVFTHMMPEIREVFAQIAGAGLLPGMEAPAGEIFLCVGFFLVYLVEELVHAFLAGRGTVRKAGSVLALAAPPAADAPADAVVVHGHGTSGHDHGTSGHDHGTSGHDHGTAGHDHGTTIATLHAFRAYVVIVALSVHSVFEGFAVAFETASRDVWILFAAIATHKAIVSFCLGEQLLATRRSVGFVLTSLLGTHSSNQKKRNKAGELNCIA